MSWEIYDAILNGRIPDEPWSPEGERVAIDTAFAIASFLKDDKPRPMREREHDAKRALKKDPDDAEARLALDMIALARAPLNTGWERPVVGKQAKGYDRRLVAHIALIWVWKHGAKQSAVPVTTLDDGTPKDRFFQWAADIIAELRWTYADGRTIPISSRWVHERYKKDRFLHA